MLLSGWAMLVVFASALPSAISSMRCCECPKEETRCFRYKSKSGRLTALEPVICKEPEPICSTFSFMVWSWNKSGIPYNPQSECIGRRSKQFELICNGTLSASCQRREDYGPVLVWSSQKVAKHAGCCCVGGECNKLTQLDTFLKRRL